MSQDGTRTVRKKTLMEYVFCLVIGGLYLFALNRTIVTATFIRIEPLTMYIMGMVSMLLFIVILYNTVTRITTVVIALLIALFVLFTLEDVSYQYPHFYDLFLMARGYMGYRSDLARTAAWLISLSLGFVMVVFTLHMFNFTILAAGGLAIFLLSWIPGFTRDELSFLFFLLGFCLLLMRRMNKSNTLAVLAAPLCAILVWTAHGQIPHESALFVRRDLRETADGRFTVIGDLLFEAFNPMYFSFQSTGFSGSGGRLGGPVTPNNRTVMTAQAPGGTYIAGAVSNTFTGTSWIPTINEGDINTHGLTPGQFEMLETAAAFMRNATIAHQTQHISIATFFDLLPSEDLRNNFHARHFQTLGVGNDLIVNYYLHSYLPMDIMTIGIGTNRTGSIFTPLRSRTVWFHPYGADYSGVATVSPLGYMRAPGFMSRNTTYHIQFMNVNTSLSYVQDILRQTGRGVYAARVADFGEGQVISLGDVPSEFLPESPLASPEGAWSRLIAAVAADAFAPGLPTTSVIQSEAVITIPGAPPISLPPLEPIITGSAADAVSVGAGFVGTGAADLMHSSLVFDRIFAHHGDTESLRRDISRMGAEMHEFADEFTAWDMNRLFDSFVETGFSVHTYIPSEYHLLHWLDLFSSTILAEYAEQVRRHFMDVPETVPQQVHDLTHEIIRGLDNEFDKVMAIRNYLLQFPYTLSPMFVPRGVCFVYHFLFVGQEGYCTYFASAMAIMSRIAGVPSRYVEGFVLPPNANAHVPITITNRMAHAWAEVYLEGFGWLIVEATPTYHLMMDPNTVHVPLSGLGTDMDPDWLRAIQERMFFDDEYEYWMEQMMRAAGVFPDGTPGALPSGFAGGGTGEPPITITAYEVRTIVLIIMAVILGIALLFMYSRHWRVWGRIKRVKTLSPNQQVMAYFEGILDIVTYYSKPLQIGETPKAYGTHMGKRFAFQSDSVFFRDLIALYYKAKYSAGTISDEELALMEEAYYDMINMLKNVRNRPRFVYLRYVRMVGLLNLY